MRSGAPCTRSGIVVASHGGRTAPLGVGKRTTHSTPGHARCWSAFAVEVSVAPPDELHKRAERFSVLTLDRRRRIFETFMDHQWVTMLTLRVKDI